MVRGQYRRNGWREEKTKLRMLVKRLKGSYYFYLPKITNAYIYTFIN